MGASQRLACSRVKPARPAQSSSWSWPIFWMAKYWAMGMKSGERVAGSSAGADHIRSLDDPARNFEKPEALDDLVVIDLSRGCKLSSARYQGESS